MSNPSAIFELAYGGELEELEKAMSSNNEQCVEDSFKGSTPLHWACLGGQLDVARWLVTQANVDPQKLNQDGRSALFFACEGCNLSTVIWLVEECAADPNARDIIDGQTPLHRVCCAGIVRGVDNAVPTIQYLLAQGKADPSVTDTGGHLPEEPVENVSSVLWKGKHLGIDHLLKVARGEEKGTITGVRVQSKTADSSPCASKEKRTSTASAVPLPAPVKKTTPKETVLTPSVQTPQPTVQSSYVKSNIAKNDELPPSDRTATTKSKTRETSTTPEQYTSSSNEEDSPPVSPRTRPSHVDAMKQAFEKKKKTSFSSSDGSPLKERRGSGASAFMNKLKMFGGKKECKT